MNNHKRFIELARHVATWSHDTNKNGVVIVRDNIVQMTGYNGFPSKVKETYERMHDCDNHSQKLLYTSHAEENAISFCAKYGIKTQHADMYVTRFPCNVCARMIIQAGISHVYIDSKYQNTEFYQKYQTVLNISKTMFDEAGIRYSFVHDVSTIEVETAISLLRDLCKAARHGDQTMIDKIQAKLIEEANRL